jgi:hypothetical protein
MKGNDLDDGSHLFRQRCPFRAAGPLQPHQPDKTPVRFKSSNTCRARFTIVSVSALSSRSRRYAGWVTFGIARQAEPGAGGATVGWCALLYGAGPSPLPPQRDNAIEHDLGFHARQVRPRDQQSGRVVR